MTEHFPNEMNFKEALHIYNNQETKLSFDDWCKDSKIIVINDPINHPKHYNMGKFEVIDVIEDWKLDFHLGCAVKYIARAKHKDNELEDLKKAIWYINRKIEQLKKEVESKKND